MSPNARTMIRNLKKNAVWLKAVLAMVLGLRPKLRSGGEVCGCIILFRPSTIKLCIAFDSVSLKFHQYQVEKPMANINSKIKIF